MSLNERITLTFVVIDSGAYRLMTFQTIETE